MSVTSRRVHVFPVPDGMTPEQAWAEIEVFGKLAEGRSVGENGEGGSWAVLVLEDDDES